MSSGFDPGAGTAHMCAMSQPPTTVGDQEPAADPAPLLDVVVYPHRSLGPTGFLMLMAVLSACSFTIGMVFYLSGAWPVIGFLGLDVLIVYVAFRLNYRAARAYETVRLTREALEVTRVDSSGRGRRITLQPYWLAVDMDDPPRRHSRLTLRTHGRRLEIGGFLTPDEKLDLARALRRALEEVRQPAAPKSAIPGSAVAGPA
jgi:uncharacterized membrane protein